ncbi:uncharacterized protein LOC111059454 [Nilaparvata lugens]|uniref:uncharacterized protein LOC111059454 n=1 Tax=Nilaparvata lugens TaxID=108931 RepID=UPI00193CF290|nr:uncharacterized protein LOC111059454 [Nilaparvata lugens]XP_039294397.1 uncharacterized protein LOC111059454 [Nilaparvata lugens]
MISSYKLEVNRCANHFKLLISTEVSNHGSHQNRCPCFGCCPDLHRRTLWMYFLLPAILLLSTICHLCPVCSFLHLFRTICVLCLGSIFQLWMLCIILKLWLFCSIGEIRFRSSSILM